MFLLFKMMDFHAFSRLPKHGWEVFIPPTPKLCSGLVAQVADEKPEDEENPEEENSQE